MEKKAMIGAIMAIVAVILIGVTFVLPWYTVNVKESTPFGLTVEFDVDFYLDHVTIKTPLGTNITDYSHSGMSHIASTFRTTQILNIVSLIFVLIGFIGALRFAIGKLGKGVAVALVVIGFILALITPLYLMITLPSAIEQDLFSEPPYAQGIYQDMGKSFFGYKKETSETVTWGGGAGWWLAIIGMILMLIALIFVAMAKEVPAGYAPPYSQQWGEYPQQPSQPPQMEHSQAPPRGYEQVQAPPPPQQPQQPPVQQQQAQFITVTCPYCGVKYQIPANMRGQWIRCSNCGNNFYVQ